MSSSKRAMVCRHLSCGCGPTSTRCASLRASWLKSCSSRWRTGASGWSAFRYHPFAAQSCLSVLLHKNDNLVPQLQAGPSRLAEGVPLIWAYAKQLHEKLLSGCSVLLNRTTGWNLAMSRSMYWLAYCLGRASAWSCKLLSPNHLLCHGRKLCPTGIFSRSAALVQLS